MKNQKMRVWWISTGSEAFYIPVNSIEEARKIMDVLAYYDCFLMNQEVRGDYANCGGLEVWDEEEQEWNDWYFEDEITYYDDVDEYIENVSPMKDKLEAQRKEMASQVHFD